MLVTSCPRLPHRRPIDPGAAAPSPKQIHHLGGVKHHYLPDQSHRPATEKRQKGLSNGEVGTPRGGVVAATPPSFSTPRMYGDPSQLRSKDSDSREGKKGSSPNATTSYTSAGPTSADYTPSRNERRPPAVSLSRPGSYEPEAFNQPAEEFDPTNYTVTAMIGQGGYAIVQVLKHKVTGKTYALKQTAKSDFSKPEELGMAFTEFGILNLREEYQRRQRAAFTPSSSTPASNRIQRIVQETGHQFFPDFYGCWQDDHFIYFFMEYLPGGDLMKHLIDLETFPEQVAKFYVAEIALALGYLHDTLHFVHRDVKPDNVLFTPEGHIKLVDFGLSREIPPHRGDTGAFPEAFQSAAGTPDYMAPEVHRAGKPHDRTVDWWSLGIIMYEMLFGGPPLSDVQHRPDVTAQLVRHWTSFLTAWPSEPPVSNLAKNLLENLIAEREDRYRTVEEILSHPWFSDLDLGRITQCKAPIIPVVKGDDDVSNFDCFSTERKLEWEMQKRKKPINPEVDRILRSRVSVLPFFKRSSAVPALTALVHQPEAAMPAEAALSSGASSSSRTEPPLEVATSSTSSRLEKAAAGPVPQLSFPEIGSPPVMQVARERSLDGARGGVAPAEFELRPTPPPATAQAASTVRGWHGVTPAAESVEVSAAPEPEAHCSQERQLPGVIVSPRGMRGREQAPPQVAALSAKKEADSREASPGMQHTGPFAAETHYPPPLSTGPGSPTPPGRPCFGGEARLVHCCGEDRLTEEEQEPPQMPRARDLREQAPPQRPGALRLSAARPELRTARVGGAQSAARCRTDALQGQPLKQSRAERERGRPAAGPPAMARLDLRMEGEVDASTIRGSRSKVAGSAARWSPAAPASVIWPEPVAVRRVEGQPRGQGRLLAALISPRDPTSHQSQQVTPPACRATLEALLTARPGERLAPGERGGAATERRAPDIEAATHHRGGVKGCVMRGSAGVTTRPLPGHLLDAGPGPRSFASRSEDLAAGRIAAPLPSKSVGAPSASGVLAKVNIPRSNGPPVTTLLPVRPARLLARPGRVWALLTRPSGATSSGCKNPLDIAWRSIWPAAETTSSPNRGRGTVL